jgi:hypothetical protein
LKRIVYIFLFLIPLFFFCTKKKLPVDETILGLDYYPTTAGKFIVYDVDSIIYTDLPKDTIIYKYRIKEKIADSFIDNQGKSAIRFERYIKKYNPTKSYDSIPWIIKEVWMLNADNKSIQLLESNTRYIKLVFPVQDKITWNGNSYNTLEEWQYTYDYIDKTETINGNSFSNILKVKQKFYSTSISFQSYTEKYAKGVGLIYREMIDLISNKSVSAIPVQDRIETGIIYKQTFVSKGNE